MIYIFEQGNYVLDGNTITEEEKAKAVVVAPKPIKEEKEGKVAKLKWDAESQTAWYEYVDIPITEDDKISELEKQVNALNIAMAEIMGV